jgi:prepilin-type N-terminal cleavage/methylation domain-containing protein
MGTRRDQADAGFTLVEVLVSLAVIGVVMTAVTTFFVQSMVNINYQGARQAAIQVASDEMAQLRQLPGSSAHAWITSQNDTTVETKNVQTLNGIAYTSVWTCSNAVALTACPATGSGPAQMNLVVTVSWVDKACATGTCHYAAVTQVSTAQIEPVFP